MRQANGEHRALHREVEGTCTANVRAILLSLTTDVEYDATNAVAIGVIRAQAGLPLATAIAGDRMAFRRLWDLLVSEGKFSTSDSGRDALSSLTVQLHTVEDLFTNARRPIGGCCWMICCSVRCMVDGRCGPSPTSCGCR
jgi:hypothetical protein